MAKSKSIKKQERLVIIDSNAIIHRAFHALPPLTSPKGEPTNAVYGFTTMLLRIIRELKPDYIAGAFDTPKPTFRHIAYEQYKATRTKAPDELYVQIPRVKEMLGVFGIPVFEKEGFEADDVIGTIVEIAGKKYPGLEIVIVTGDMDTLQLVNDKTKVWTMRKGITDTVFYDPKAVVERFNVPPESMPDYKGLRGDPSDNIIGVRGIGEKTASELLGKYKTLEKLYQALEKGTLLASVSVKTKLRDGKEGAFFSRTLATIRRDTPLIFDLAALALKRAPESHKREKLFRELGFFSLLKRISEENTGSNKKAAATPALAQGSLLTEISFPGSAAFKKFIAKKNHKEAALEFFPDKKTLLASFPGGEIFSLKIVGPFSVEVKNFLESETLKYIFDAKPLYRELVGSGVVAKNVFDFLLAAYLFDSGRGEYAVDEFLSEILGVNEVPQKMMEKFKSFFKAGSIARERLEKEELTGVFKNIELPLTPILAEMEAFGIYLDQGLLKRLSKKVDRELADLTGVIYKDAGGEFNINSPQQVSEILFVKLGIAVKGVRKTGGGKISTKFSELSKLIGRHPVIEKLIRFRELSKLKSTYVDVLPSFLGKDGRLHTTFNQAGTQTGRMSSENPNLQNIPIKTEFGREVRKAFAAEIGWTLVSFDYSQIELRIAADLSGDKKMIEAFKKGLDIHALTASEVNNVPLEKVTPELRRKAKALNFGVLYGMGARGFAESAGINIGEAQIFIEEYFDDFKGVAEFIEKTKKFAHDHGFVKTAFGRKRYLPGILSANPMIRSEAERMAVNMPIQGTATGDVMKLAMISVHGLLEKNYYAKARMLLQIHDELLCEIEESAVSAVVPVIKTAMESVWHGKVKLRVDVKTGKNWAELE
ncbi:MAG: DNA polymerase I [bacterium]|nr:DNA polymerase I [bacterium]